LTFKVTETINAENDSENAALLEEIVNETPEIKDPDGETPADYKDPDEETPDCKDPDTETPENQDTDGGTPPDFLAALSTRPSCQRNEIASLKRVLLEKNKKISQLQNKVIQLEKQLTSCRQVLQSQDKVLNVESNCTINLFLFH
jgi:uncharacterized coiled-coil protein SlyX